MSREPLGQSAKRNIDGAAQDRRICGSGEMATLICEFDWTSTPLGPISAWSETLLTTVNIILSAEIPIQIFWGPEMVTIYNDALIPTLDDKHPKALGQQGREVWKEAWPAVGGQLESVLRQGKSVNFKNVFLPLLRNGVLEDMYWDYSYSPVFDPDGDVAGIFNVAHNTTAAVLIRQQLAVVAERHRQVLEATTDAVVGVDRNWIMTYLNPKAEQMYASNMNIVGRNIWETFPDSVYEGSPFLEHYHRAMDQGIPGSFEAHYPDPLNLWLRLEVYPTKDGIVLFSRDISEHKRTSQALLQTEKLAAVGRLAASIAHEINNPLESVTNLLYLARRTDDTAELHDYLDTAERELRRVSVISNQTLRFYKQSTNAIPITCQELFESVLSIYQGRLVNSRVYVEKRKRARHPVECFDGEIRQVLNNLVGNAIDAMHPAGGRLLVRSRDATNWKTGQRGIVLTVADIGHGMPRQTLSKIFEAFYTTKGIGGTGLGLWVSKEIANRHGGSLGVRSSQKEGRSGTVFALFLPSDAVIRQ